MSNITRLHEHTCQQAHSHHYLLDERYTLRKGSMHFIFERRRHADDQWNVDMNDSGKCLRNVFHHNSPTLYKGGRL